MKSTIILVDECSMHSAAQPGQLVLTSGIELMVLESSHSSHRLSRLPTTVGCMEDYNTES